MDYKIEVFIDGKCIPVPSYAKLQELLKYVGECEEAKNRLDTYIESEAVSTVSTSTATSEAPPVDATDATELPAEQDSAISYKRRIGPHERAWERLGRPATVEEIYQSALDMGYVPRAGKPFPAFKRTIHENKRFRPQGFAPDGKPLLVLAESDAMRSTEPAEGDMPPKRPASAFGFSTPPGQQAADYAKRVLEEAKRGMRIDELAEAMLKAGWKTTSPTPDARIKSAAAAINHAKALFIKRAGLWELVEWQSDKLAV